MVPERPRSLGEDGAVLDGSGGDGRVVVVGGVVVGRVVGRPAVGGVVGGGVVGGGGVDRVVGSGVVGGVVVTVARVGARVPSATAGGCATGAVTTVLGGVLGAGGLGSGRAVAIPARFSASSSGRAAVCAIGCGRACRIPADSGSGPAATTPDAGSACSGVSCWAARLIPTTPM
ncbi:MAG: hypothetical protein ABT15_29235 [Pseudonocardia sp. SCN 73-27]|nr:MAG: hypothetical protein ABS80_19810 [Pseudonocardia sp. SCN 72-51]ODV00553.1 MAG: hypothetical protein ABT15_29235 [Pseudonocardia sp. SCN 73-27]